MTYQYVCEVCIGVVEHRKRSDLNPESRWSIDEHATALSVGGGCALDWILNDSRRREQLNVTVLEKGICCVTSF